MPPLIFPLSSNVPCPCCWQPWVVGTCFVPLLIGSSLSCFHCGKIKPGLWNYGLVILGSMQKGLVVTGVWKRKGTLASSTRRGVWRRARKTLFSYGKSGLAMQPLSNATAKNLTMLVKRVVLWGLGWTSVSTAGNPFVKVSRVNRWLDLNEAAHMFTFEQGCRAVLNLQCNKCIG